MLLKTLYDELVTKVKSLSTTRLANKSQYDVDKQSFVKKIEDVDKKKT